MKDANWDTAMARWLLKNVHYIVEINDRILWKNRILNYYKLSVK